MIFYARNNDDSVSFIEVDCVCIDKDKKEILVGGDGAAKILTYHAEDYAEILLKSNEGRVLSVIKYSQ